MATQAQIIANQANSQKSTGPTSVEGKAASSRNRLSHGFASNTRFIAGEDPEEFHALLDDLIDEYQPATQTEQILVERMAHNQWLSLRACRIQDNILGQIYELRDSSLCIPGEVDRHLPLFIRYQTTADRAFHKAHAELVKAQKQREKSEIGFESQKAAATAEAVPLSPPPCPPEPPAPPAKPEEPPAPAEKITIEPDSMSIEEEIAWVMNASIEEIRASGL